MCNSLGSKSNFIKSTMMNLLYIRIFLTNMQTVLEIFHTISIIIFMIDIFLNFRISMIFHQAIVYHLYFSIFLVTFYF